MTLHHLYPLVFKPIYKDYVWGGNKIATKLGRSLPPGIYAESWEVADRAEGQSLVENGPLAGRSLKELMNLYKSKLTGSKASTLFFPLLIKIIDAGSDLSLQVHPDEKAALALKGEPKTEMWYVLEAEKGACVYIGFQKEVTESVLLQALRDKTMRELMRRIVVQKGDVIHVPAGRVHAIGKGCMMLEIQQNSNTTYRLYDWDRLGLDKKPRELHLHEGLKAIQWNDHADSIIRPVVFKETAGCELLHQTRYFTLLKKRFEKEDHIVLDGTSFAVIFPLSCALDVTFAKQKVHLPKNRSCLVPASCDLVKIKAKNNEASYLMVTL